MRVISLLLLSLLVTALPARAAVAPLDRVAVVVDESVIMESEVDARIADVKAKFAQSKQDLPPDDILRKQVIDQLILENIQLTMADRAGIKIDDKTLNAALADVADQNNHESVAQFQEELDKAAPGSYAEAREQIKRELMLNRLRQRAMQDRIKISDQDVQNFIKSPQGKLALASEYRLGHILINLPDAATPEQIDDGRKKAEAAMAELAAGHDFAQVAAHYSNAEDALKGGDLGWRKQAELPTLFSDSVSTMKVGDVAGPLRTPGGFHVIKLLDKRGDSMKVVQYHVRHILIRPSEILSSDDAHQKLLDLRAKIIKGGNFADIARISDDPGSARNGGDLGWVSKGDMVPEFDQVMLATPVGQISDVFQSSYGWHILQVEAIRDQDMSQQFRESQARQALYERQYDEELNAWLREMRGSAYIDIKDTATTAP